MKKIMIVGALAMSVLASGAAQMKWASNALKAPGTTSNLSSSYGGSVAFFSLTSKQYDTLIAGITTSMTGDQASKYIYEAYSSKTPTSTSTSFSKGINTIIDPGTYSPNDSAYAVLIYTGYGNTTKTGDQYYIANVAKWDFTSDTGKTMNGMGTVLFGADTGSKALSWQTVPASTPEPTSGLLLLIGVAGLALRRRRA